MLIDEDLVAVGVGEGDVGRSLGVVVGDLLTELCGAEAKTWRVRAIEAYVRRIVDATFGDEWGAIAAELDRRLGAREFAAYTR